MPPSGVLILLAYTKSIILAGRSGPITTGVALTLVIRLPPITQQPHGRAQVTTRQDHLSRGSTNFSRFLTDDVEIAGWLALAHLTKLLQCRVNDWQK